MTGGGRSSDDDTVVVPRAGGACGPDDTVVLGRAADADDTVAVRRATPAAPDEPDDTVALGSGRQDPTVPVVGAEPTVRLARGESKVPTARIAGSAPVRTAMRPGRRRPRGALRPAPVPSGFGGVPVVGQGPGAVSTYATRVLTAPPAAPTASVADPGRIIAPVPSVSLGSRRATLLTLGAVGVAVLLLAGAFAWSLATLLAS